MITRELFIGIVSVLIWFVLGIFSIVSGEVFYAGLFGFCVGSWLVNCERERQVREINQEGNK